MSLTMTPPTSSSRERPPGAGQVVREDTGLQPEDRVVDPRDRVVEVAERERDDERREGLVRADLGGERHVGQDRRREERAVGRAAEQELAAERDGLVDPALGPARGGRVDHRPDVGRRVERVARP